MVDDRLLSKVGIFQDPDLASTVISAAPGQVIYQPETPAERVYFVQRGEVRLYTVGPEGGNRLVAIMGSGDWFGVGALAGKKTYGMRATALSSSMVLEVRADRFLEVLSRRPEAMVQLSRDLAARLLYQTREASSMVFEDCNERLINALVRFSRSAASTQRDDGVVLRITHEQLAQAIGVARETVSLALTQLRHQNLLRTGRNQLMFNPDVLRQFNNGKRGLTHKEIQLSA